MVGDCDAALTGVSATAASARRRLLDAEGRKDRVFKDWWLGEEEGLSFRFYRGSLSSSHRLPVDLIY
jgi:hypothetical protein